MGQIRGNFATESEYEGVRQSGNISSLDIRRRIFLRNSDGRWVQKQTQQGEQAGEQTDDETTTVKAHK